MFEGEPSDKADVYAFGMSLYEVLSGKRPFFEKYTHSIRAAVLKGERPDVSFLGGELRALIEKCWAQGSSVFECLLSLFRSDQSTVVWGYHQNN